MRVTKKYKNSDKPDPHAVEALPGRQRFVYNKIPIGTRRIAGRKGSAMFRRLIAGRRESGRTIPFLVVSITVLCAIVIALAWLGVANAGLMMPFIIGEGSATPEAPPPWSDPPTHIEVIAPVAEVAYHSPMDITGLSQTFEGHVGIRLLNHEGKCLPNAQRLEARQRASISSTPMFVSLSRSHKLAQWRSLK